MNTDVKLTLVTMVAGTEQEKAHTESYFYDDMSEVNGRLMFYYGDRNRAEEPIALFEFDKKIAGPVELRQMYKDLRIHGH